MTPPMPPHGSAHGAPIPLEMHDTGIWRRSSIDPGRPSIAERDGHEPPQMAGAHRQEIRPAHLMLAANFTGHGHHPSECNPGRTGKAGVAGTVTTLSPSSQVSRRG